MPQITPRLQSPDRYRNLISANIPPVMARLFAARNIDTPVQLSTELTHLIGLDAMQSIDKAAGLLADAISEKQKLLVIADYDADGATACAVAIRGLRAMGAKVEYLVPNRFEFGYGLTPEIVRLAYERRPDMLITVDNGIASIDGVAEANRLGMRVIVTDHHLPGDALPDAAAIVNPNQLGCQFPSKNLAGVGVIFYVLLALRSELRQRAFFNSEIPRVPFYRTTASGNQPAEPNLADLLDIIALGTVADVVKLDDNNRRLVAQGLARIRAGRCCAGIRALLHVAGRPAERVSTYELGFILGPRLNAAGRLDDMSLGIECLITDNEDHALKIATQLDALNRERREIEADMQESALTKLDDIDPRENYTLAVFEPDWHQGVIGILASRLKDRFHRPVIAFARGSNGTLKGSGRSIPALHLRDALDLVSKQHPDLIEKFGGHAAAAGLTIPENALPDFTAAFEAVARRLLSPADLTQIIETDGELSIDELNMTLATDIQRVVWGQGFPAPRFEGVFRIENRRIVGEKHLKLQLKYQSHSYNAIIFFEERSPPDQIRAVYRPDINEYNGNSTLQLIIEHWEPA
ncbi:MAG: single-stranded-DNA-specific exonuclease RecJ [Pseudomonadota bacterium]